MNGKRYVVDVWGEQVLQHRRVLTLEVPEGTSGDEIEALEMCVFDAVFEDLWDIEDSGIYGKENAAPEVLREATTTEKTDCKLIRNADGELVLDASSIE